MEKNIDIYATSLKHLEISIGRNVDGIVGYDLLHHHAIRINYGDKMFEIYKLGNIPKIGSSIDFELHNAGPVIDGTVTLNNNEELTGKFFFNTGAGTTLDFNTPFAKSNDIVDKTGEHYSYLVKGLSDVETKHYEGRVVTFKYGSFSHSGLPIGISQVKTGIQGDKKIAGIIGNRLLKQYNVIIDYKSRKIWMEKNDNYTEAIPVNCSGIDVQLNEDQSSVLIHQVIENSPASEAGIMLNDELISINGDRAMDIGIAGIKSLLKKDGTEVTLKINSNGSEKEVVLKLKSLI